jgi:K+-sensing histidine kinase KdpD
MQLMHAATAAASTSQRLFERFLHQGSQPLLNGSVGRGLAIAQLLVTKMEGDVSYERRDGLTVFRVELAAVPSANAVDTATDPAFGATAG